jgi:hypothetical protein
LTWNTLTNLSQGQIVTETHMDNIRENIEHLGDNIQIGGMDAKDLTAATSAGRMATGTYTGDGNATQAITGVGFEPEHVFIYRQLNSSGGGDWWKSDVDGTKSRSQSWGYKDDHIISLDSDGFTVGDGTGGSNEVNVNTGIYTYVAWRT